MTAVTAPAGYDEILAALPAQVRRRVSNAVASSMIEGDSPDTESVTLLADLALGKITGEDYRRAVVAGIRTGRP